MAARTVRHAHDLLGLALMTTHTCVMAWEKWVAGLGIPRVAIIASNMEAYGGFHSIFVEMVAVRKVRSEDFLASSRWEDLHLCRTLNRQIDTYMAVLTKCPRRLVELVLVAIVARGMVVSSGKWSETLPHVLLGVTVLALQSTVFVAGNALVISGV